MGPIFIFLVAMGGIHILADRLLRDYELLRGNGVSAASRRHRHSLLGIILVILHNNIIFCDLFRYIMRCCNVDMYKFERMAIANYGTPEFIWYCDECGRTIRDDEADNNE